MRRVVAPYVLCALLLPGMALPASAGTQRLLPCAGLPDEAARLEALNRLRAQAQHCGGQARAAASPLRWQARLQDSALAQAEALAPGDSLSHQGLRGASLRERLHQAGYLMRLSGENLAAGPATVDEALALWLASASHCENLMEPRFRDAALVCLATPGPLQRVWVLHLGRAAGDGDGD